MPIYEAVNWPLVAAVGGVMSFFMFRAERHVGPDAIAPDLAPYRVVAGDEAGAGDAAAG